MPRTSFHEWLRTREVPDATTLALLIVRTEAAGVSRDDLRRLVRIPLKNSWRL
jgi:hypothetical protein